MERKKSAFNVTVSSINHQLNEVKFRKFVVTTLKIKFIKLPTTTKPEKKEQQQQNGVVTLIACNPLISYDK